MRARRRLIGIAWPESARDCLKVDRAGAYVSAKNPSSSRMYIVCRSVYRTPCPFPHHFSGTSGLHSTSAKTMPDFPSKLSTRFFVDREFVLRGIDLNLDWRGIVSFRSSRSIDRCLTTIIFRVNSIVVVIQFSRR